MKLLSTLKCAIVPRGRGPRRILTGPFRGLIMQLDLATQFQFYAGTFERELSPWILRLSHRIRSAVDIGAADGEYTLYFLARTSAERVYGFEPQECYIDRIHLNLSLNQVDASRLKLSDKYVSGDHRKNSVTLDSLQDALPLPCFVKMDIDGGEMEALKSSSQLCGRSAIRWLIETHSRELESNCISFLQAAGFRTRVIRPAWWRCILPEQRVDEHNQWLVAAKPGDITI